MKKALLIAVLVAAVAWGVFSPFYIKYRYRRSAVAYELLAHIWLEPLHHRLEEYRKLHDGRYPAAIEELGPDLPPEVEYRPPGLAPAGSDIVAVMDFHEDETSGWLFWVWTKVISHPFALHADGTVGAIEPASSPLH